MMIKYRLVYGVIFPYEVVKETEKQIAFICGSRERKELKDCEGQSWHDTWEQAHERMISNADDKVARAESRLMAAKRELQNARKYKKEAA